MISNVTKAGVTTVSTVPVSRNNTTTVSKDYISANADFEKITNNQEVESPSKEIAASENDTRENGEETQPAPTKKSFGFYAIIAALAFSGLLTSLETTITSTALPTITANLTGANLYIWVVNGFYLTQTAFQPLFGQIANIYGRRWPMIFTTAAFTLGSGLSGGANNINMLIAGRLIHGIGAGGINVLIEIIICDLLPLRERGRYLGIMFGLIALGATLGPLFGGLIVQHTSWRWIFYLNVPIGGVALITLFAFLRVKADNTSPSNPITRLRRIDWFGNLLFILSMISILLALSWAGTLYPWTSYRIILPLILGLTGLISFVLYESSKSCPNPTMPHHLFTNLTSSTAFLLTFIHSLSSIPTIYFLPVYFQSVRLSTPSRSGIQLLPTILFMIPSGILSGVLLSKFGRYRPIHYIGFAFMVVGFGILSLLKGNSRMREWIGYQIFSAMGAGLLLPVLLPAVQASLKEEDTALSTSTWAFIRSFGLIWGATIPTAVFNNLIYRIDDMVIREELENGKAYEHATKVFMDGIEDVVVRGQVMGVYVEALRTVWFVSMAFVLVGFLLVAVQKEVPLRKDLDTKFSMEERNGSEKIGESSSNDVEIKSV